MLGNTFYNQTIKNTIIAFGNLFSGIKIERQDSEDVVRQTITVPLAYGPKDKSIVRTDEDPKLKHNVYTIVPRMTFEIIGYQYDATRKTSRMSRITCDSADGTRKSMFAPTPYNLEIQLYIVTKNSEDAFQIIEQILPVFSPEYTVSVNAIPEYNLIQDTPFILNSISVQDDYDGDFQSRRFVTHTLSFTAKLNIFGESSSQGVINKVIVNMQDPDRKYMATQITLLDPVNENWSDSI